MVVLPFCELHLSARLPPDPRYPRELVTVGDHVRARRLDRGMTQREVADTLGTCVQTLHRWESNTGEPDIRHWAGVIAFLGYDLVIPQPETFAERLVTTRRARGLSQKELAEVLSVDPTSISRWERGRVPFRRVREQVLGVLDGREHWSSS